MLRTSFKEILVKPEKSIRYFYRFVSTNSNDDEDGIKDKKPKEEIKNNPALQKLNALLKQMIDEDVVADKSKKSTEFARATRKNFNNELADKKAEDSTSKQPTESNLKSTVKKVAEVIGGNQKQTESELLQKLLVTVADPNKQPSKSLSDIIKGMTIDREQKPAEISRAQQIRQVIGSTRLQDKSVVNEKIPYKKRIQKSFEATQLETVNIFGSRPLGIFSTDIDQEGVQNKIWDKLYKRELRLAVTHPPANYFQEMILWTEQGKLWKFPIDNEQDLEERDVPFMEHIFLEKHLAPWCPKKGPIRHFMELVCVGLSKNPYLSVEEKKGHIKWFKDYFAEKQRLLKDVGAIPQEFDINKEDVQKIEA
ncbi:28S ribosomal protein S31, mitochondrial [Agrilus planipennis]|uniref:Small ribosomal subunit protein mS31 n=1 Tax=Agrilus planipennis TaxID=224129 RepID=A0A1W4WL93_AGRPL|nr:28S ribosomal protein S31, mitochondrial [Agrilus planipennis]